MGQGHTTGDSCEVQTDLPYIAAMAFITESDTYNVIEAIMESPNIHEKIGSLKLVRGYGATVRPSCIYDFRNWPLDWELAGDLITCLTAIEEDEAGVAHFITIVFLMSDGPLPYVEHRITHMPKCTLAATGAAGFDSKNAITLTDKIPPGDYELWGADLVSATATIATFNVPGYARPPAIFARRTEAGGLYELNKCMLPSPQIFKYKSGVLPVTINIVAEAAETPDSLQLYLNKVG